MKELIAQAGLSQRELARRIGIKETTINSWVTGRYDPTLKNILPLARELNLSIETIAKSLGYDVSGIPGDHDEEEK